MTRKKARRKRVPIALLLSAAAHGAAVLFLIYFARTTLVPKRGVISVDFIESVHHESSTPTFRPGPAKVKTEKPQPAENKTRPQQPVGDPTAGARETDAYIQSVLEIINRRKVYPKDSVERGEEGRVVVGVSVAADGKIMDVRIEEASSFHRLDNAALKTVSEISTFPPLPEVIEAPLHLHIPLLYRLESR